MKASDFDFDLLLPFEVPRTSTASDESPVRIEAELVRAEDRGPLLLRGYVLVPTAKNGNKPREYLKFDFGSMDVVAPLKKKETIVLFPYDDADAIRKLVKPGDVVWVGVEALSLDKDGPTKMDLDLKVRRVRSW